MKRLFIFIGLLLSLTLSAQINVGVISAQKRITSTSSTLLTGLISAWEMEGSDANVNDTVSTNDGTIAGNPLREQSGKIGHCVTFDGTGDQVSMGHVHALMPNNLTLSLWFKTTSEDEGIIGNYSTDGAEQAGYLINTTWVSSSLTAVKALVGELNVNATTITGTTGIKTGAWFHAVLTSDGTTMKLYHNGSLIGSGTAYSGNIVYYEGSVFTIGSSDPTFFKFIGSIDLVRIWSRALTSTEVSELYTKENAGTTYPW